MIKVFSGVETGDFVRGHGHRLTPDWTQVWWKVVETASDKLTLINRHGRRREITYRTAQNSGIRFRTWKPGDPREDGDNL